MASKSSHTRSGLKAVLFLVVLVVLTGLAVLLQIRFRGFEGPLSDNLLLFILIYANFLLLAAVIFMTARSLWKLSEERKSRVLGAKFRTKIVVAFVSLSFIPVILLFIIGSGMFTRSMERLFSLRIEKSLQDSVSVTQAYYDRMKSQALAFARRISRQAAEERVLLRFDQQAIREYLGNKAEEYGLGSVELILPSPPQAVHAVTGQFPRDTFAPAPADLAGRAFGGEEAAAVSDLRKKGEIVRAVVPLRMPAEEGRVAGAIAVSYYVPSSISRKVDEIRLGYGEYRSSLKSKELLKLSYRLGFLAVTLALLLAAVWVALRVAAGITVPIRKLAEGTVEVARGNLDHRVDAQSGDEVGLLVESFNRMTADLRSSREQIRQEGEYKDTLLANIDTGVVSMDRGGRITTVNPAAAKILGTTPGDALHRRYDEAFSFIDLAPVRDLFRRLEEGHGRAEGEISLAVRGRALTLRMRVSTLRDATGALVGSVITFDDLTELFRAQKAATWQDVARQIAHEVKNPLTPIKLSAERLRKKFSEQAPDFGEVFDESSKTIIQEVNGLEGLLNEFSEFARMPRPNPAPGGIAPVIESALQLFAGAHKDIRFIRDVPPGLPEALIDQEQIKRVLVNLFKNAVEVMNGKGTVWVAARSLPAEGTLRIEVADDGPGIPAADVPRVFEPSFSRKKKGGGLGLAIVERIIADHNGAVHAERNAPRGAKFVIDLPVKRQRA